MVSEEEKKKQLVKRLEDLMKALNIKSSRQLAMAINMDVSQMNKVFRYEIGFPFSQSEKLQKKFGINANWVMTGEGEMRSKSPNVKLGIDMDQLVSDNLQMKALVKTLYNRMARHEAKIYGISVEDALNQMEADTTISLKELMKQHQQ